MPQSHHLRKKLERTFRQYGPFGPVDAALLQDTDLQRAFFEDRNALYRALRLNPRLIVGRKGSGKTAFLKSVYREGIYSHIIEISLPEHFQEVVKAVHRVIVDEAFVENAAKLWRQVLYTAVFECVVAREPQAAEKLPTTVAWLQRMGVKPPMTPDDAILRAAVRLAQEQETENYESHFHDTFAAARAETTRYLDDHGFETIVLIDSLEGYPIFSLPGGRTLAGLFKCVHEFFAAGEPYYVRLCLPAELIHHFEDLMSNAGKEISSREVLHWHPRELLSLAAARLKLYFDTCDPKTASRLSHLSPEVPSDAREILEYLLPKEILNGCGRPERTEPYLFRHTQLLPRQLLNLLNEIGIRALSQSGPLSQVRSEEVVASVKEAEVKISQEIFTAFPHHSYDLHEICRQCVPNLRQPFHLDELAEVLLHKVSAFYERRDPHSFARLMIEIGALGLVRETTAHYIEAEFEYQLPHQLIFADTDQLCWHPIFAGPYNTPIQEPANVTLPVYPRGIDPQMADWRRIIR